MTDERTIDILVEKYRGKLMQNNPEELLVGHDSVVMGNVTGAVGNRSVVIGPTHERGNVVLNTPMAVGYGAVAGPGSIAIGAFAGAGSNELLSLLAQLRSAVQRSGVEASLAKVEELTATLDDVNGQPNYPLAVQILDFLRNTATLEGVWSLIDRIREMVEQFM